MEKFKICPSCKTKNPPALFECMQCEADLTGVKITDEETEKMQEKQAAEQPTASPMVKVCDCGTHNAPNARKCTACGEELFDIAPTPAPLAETAVTYVLSSTDGQYAYTVTEGEVTVGRECVMSEYLSSKGFVSREHAVLTLDGDEFFVENVSNTNFTYVNNRKITEKTRLQDGDEIGLGGTSINGTRQEKAAYFVVRVSSCM